MSTYLQLCAKLRQNMRASGTGPTTVSGQVGELKRIVDWVSDAYVELQQKREEWRWLRSRFTFNTVASTDTYAYTSITDSRLTGTITRFARWIAFDDSGYSNVTYYLTSGGVAGENYLTFLPWEQFRLIYKRGAQTLVTGVPVYFTIDPQDELVIGPNPNGIYTIQGEYQMGPQVLAADADTPEMPARFHDLIMYGAMEKAATDGAAVERMERAVTEGRRLMRALERSQLPDMRTAPPLA